VTFEVFSKCLLLSRSPFAADRNKRVRIYVKCLNQLCWLWELSLGARIWTVTMVRVFVRQIAIISQAHHWTSSCAILNRLISLQTYSPEMHLNVFILYPPLLRYLIHRHYIIAYVGTISCMPRHCYIPNPSWPSTFLYQNSTRWPRCYAVPPYTISLIALLIISTVSDSSRVKPNTAASRYSATPIYRPWNPMNKTSLT
jgi:hypothetical protein